MYKSLLFFIVSLIIPLSTNAQPEEIDVHFSFENTTLNGNELFNIVVTMPNVRKKEVSNFPEIPDFIKKTTSYSKEGKLFKITQSYRARKEGLFILNPFVIKINGKMYSSEGTTIDVKSTIKEKAPTEESKFTSVEEDAFFKISANKNEVYIGEQITLSVALYIAKDNKAEMNFIDFKEQVNEIIKRIKPENCWSENLGQKENIIKDTIELNEKIYNRYLIYEGNFYPFDTSLITIPPAGLKMLKYKVFKTANSIERVEDYITLKSSSFKIKIKNLPKGINQEVAVGNFTLEENIKSKKITVGESFSYEFTLRGEGNFANILSPSLAENAAYEIYISNADQKKLSKNLKAKTFSFYVLFKEPGTYRLADIFRWTYFNVEKKQYETLSSKITLNVEGEEKKNDYLSYKDLGSFYQIIEAKSNRLRSTEKDQTVKFLANIIIIFMLAITAFLIFKR